MNVYRQALLVQDACNISGVVISLGKLMEELCEQVPEGVNRGEWLRSHPALLLYVDKVNDMMGRVGLADDRYVRAYEECCLRAAEERVVR